MIQEAIEQFTNLHQPYFDEIVEGTCQEAQEGFESDLTDLLKLVAEDAHKRGINDYSQWSCTKQNIAYFFKAYWNKITEKL